MWYFYLIQRAVICLTPSWPLILSMGTLLVSESCDWPLLLDNFYRKLHTKASVFVRFVYSPLVVVTSGKPSADFQQLVLDFYGKDLHCAVRNRRSELTYLKSLSERLFPYILPHQSLKCRSLCTLLRELLAGAILLPLMDVLADPVSHLHPLIINHSSHVMMHSFLFQDIVNNILLIFFDKSPVSLVHPLTLNALKSFWVWLVSLVWMYFSPQLALIPPHPQPSSYRILPTLWVKLSLWVLLYWSIVN